MPDAPGGPRPGSADRHRHPGAADRGARGVALRAPLAALTLLTTVPLPRATQAQIGAREVAASAPFFPLVGAVLGLVVGGLASVVAERSGSLLGAAVAVVLLAALTGALHLDGLADSADALGARGGAPERRLEIMRDSSTGVYGSAALAGWFVLVTAALASVEPHQMAVTLAWVLALARTLAVGHARALPPARQGGLGAGFQVGNAALVGSVVLLVLVGAGLAALPADAGWLSGPDTNVLDWSVVAAVPAYLGVLLGARRLLGGRTGDTIGATIALVEAAALLGAALTFG